MIRVFLAALVFATLPTAFEARAADPSGLWLTEKKGVIVDLYDCGENALCGRTVWMKKMFNKDGTPRLDAKNPDPDLRERHWCGIEVIRGVRAKSPGKWKGGKIYDPKTGDTFDFDISEKGENLKVRGYIGVSILGKSETWTRADDMDVELCS